MLCRYAASFSDEVSLLEMLAEALQIHGAVQAARRAKPAGSAERR